MERMNKIAGHIGANATAASSAKADSDIVVVSALRTPITKAGRGEFRGQHVEDLLAPVIRATLERTGVDPKTVGDLVCGSVLGDGSFTANKVRIAAFMGGLPEEVPVHVVNRQCSSGLQAIAHAAASIRSGYYDIGMACGVESMSHAAFSWGKEDISKEALKNNKAKACLIPMGITSENVAAKFGVSRAKQDALAAQSHARAAAATKSGRFREEIVPLTVDYTNPKTEETSRITVARDGGVREGTTVEKLAKLRTVFKKDGSTTAGNASQVSDGASVVLVMTRAKARSLGLRPLGTFRSFAVRGCDPAIMGIGPAVAIPEALKQAGLTTKDIDLYEINEAFASQAVYSVEKLGLSWDNVNVNGGAIALGHPLGCTGARMTATLLHEMAKRGARYGVVSMCIGSGMGAAAVYERE